MKVLPYGPLCYDVKLEPEELEALQKDSEYPLDWFIKDPATLIQYILERHVEYCQTRYSL